MDRQYVAAAPKWFAVFLDQRTVESYMRGDVPVEGGDDDPFYPGEGGGGLLLSYDVVAWCFQDGSPEPVGVVWTNTERLGEPQFRLATAEGWDDLRFIGYLPPTERIDYYRETCWELVEQAGGQRPRRRPLDER
jgi:hypothetical protein